MSRSTILRLLSSFLVAVATALTLVTPASATSTSTTTAVPMVSFTSHGIHFLATKGYARTHATPTAHAAVSRSACLNNDCPLSGPLVDNGGPIVSTPSVYIVLFTDTAGTLSPNNYVAGVTSPTEPNAAGAINATLDSPNATAWQTEYSRLSTSGLLHPGSYAGTITLVDPSIADAATVDDSTIAAALSSAARSGQLANVSSNSIFVTFFQFGQEVTDTNSGLNSISSFCGYHNSTSALIGTTNHSINYAVIPDESANPGCYYTSPTASAFNNMTPILSHELTEVVTDPASPVAWLTSSGEEIGDLCAAGNSPATQVTSLTGVTYDLQLEYSNMESACVGSKSLTSLSASATTPSTSSITATLTAGTSPLPSATLYLLNANGVLQSATTNAAGQATFSLSSTADSGLAVFYRGSTTYNGAMATPGALPSAPVITGFAGGNQNATVSFSAPTSTGSSPVTSYLAIATPGNETCITSNLSCTFTGLSNATTYSATVYASNNSGLSPASSSLTATPGPVPLWPTNVTAVPSSGQLQISWTPSAASSSPPPVSYTAVATPGNESCTYVVATPETDTCTITGLSNGTSYLVQVYATNNSGNSDPYGIYATPATAPSSPQDVTAASPSPQNATVSWSPPAQTGGSPVTGYTVTASPGGSTCNTTLTTCTLTGLTNGLSYTFNVTATNAAGQSAPTSSPSVTPLGPPPAPQNLSSQVLSGAVTLTWTAPVSNGGSLITGYSVTSSPAVSAPPACTDTTALSCTFTGLANGVTYTFTLTAQNSYGTGDPATLTSTPGSVPSAPSNVFAQAAPSSASVIWTAPSDNGGVPITGYIVTASPSGATCSSVVTSCGFSGLTNGVSYTFTVVAENAIGLSTSSSPSSPIVPVGPPSPPVNVSAQPQEGAVTLSWQAPVNSGGAKPVSYTATASPGLASCNTTSLSCTITGLSDATPYTFNVVASTSAGISAPATLVATPGALPLPPSSLSATSTGTEATISWAASQSTTPVSSYTVTALPGAQTCTTASLSCTIAGLSYGVTYTFSVVATNLIGTSAASAPSIPLLIDSAPSAPRGVLATSSSPTSALVVWSPPASVNGSPVSRYSVSASPGPSTCVTTSNSCTITGLTPGTAYTFTVTAFNAAGASAPSAPSSSVTPPDPSLAISAPSSALLGSPVSVRISVFPAGVTPVTVRAGTSSLEVTTNALGQVVATIVPSPTTTSIEVTADSVTRSLTFTSRIGFGGFIKSSLVPGSPRVRFTLVSATGSTAAAAALAALHQNVYLIVTRPGHPSLTLHCTLAAGVMSCAYRVPTYRVTLRVGLGSSPASATSPLVVRPQAPPTVTLLG